jgi:hypothetical protein
MCHRLVVCVSVVRPLILSGRGRCDCGMLGRPAFLVASNKVIPARDRALRRRPAVLAADEALPPPQLGMPAT